MQTPSCTTDNLMLLRPLAHLVTGHVSPSNLAVAPWDGWPSLIILHCITHNISLFWNTYRIRDQPTSGGALPLIIFSGTHWNNYSLGQTIQVSPSLLWQKIFFSSVGHAQRRLPKGLLHCSTSFPNSLEYSTVHVQ